ncbi:MAG: 2-amino-4-hydroxy-6-hydroxymethyldihydropteridine diphosphokinase [Deltaproteobacteria bacterium]|nr:2-amino-4-hydroxy-6-hydroxymethyldihydropteridine diphosphokinase [Deltaproteobacteria bacterium]
MAKKTRYFIGLGSNVGDRSAAFTAAHAALAAHGVVAAFSHVFETAPLGPSTAPYLNAALALDCDLAPEPLLAALLDIERANGRVRGERWAARTLDLDVLLAGDLVLASETLTVPHPRLHERGFVLAPLVCIAGDVRVPPSQRRVIDLYAEWRQRGEGGVALWPGTGAPLPRSSDASRVVPLATF